MIVAEDQETGEIRQFMVIDANVRLGVVQAGTHIRTFDPKRLLNYYTLVENQLNDYAARYPNSFKFLPRRAYSYLMQPDILGELSDSPLDTGGDNWFSDLFMIYSLADIRDRPIPKYQQKANIDSSFRWSTTAPWGTRTYYLQDLRYGSSSRRGWGCVVDASRITDTMRGSERNDLIQYVSKGLPIFLELNELSDFDELMQWLVNLKESGLPAPKIVYSIRTHKNWRGKLSELLEIPSSYLLISGSMITTLSDLVNDTQFANNEEWSRRLIYGSAYPETQNGDGIPEILSFLLSKTLDASPEALQRVLAGNILSLLPPKPPFIKYREPSMTAVLEGTLGRTGLVELSRVLRLLSAKGEADIVSLDPMISDDGGKVTSNPLVLTLRKPNSTEGISFIVFRERNGSLHIAGWKSAYDEKIIDRDTGNISTLLRTISKTDASILESPEHLVTFIHTLLMNVHVEDLQGAISALHFKLLSHDGKPGVLHINEHDAEMIGISDGEMLLVIDYDTGQWWGNKSRITRTCTERCVIMDAKEMVLRGLSEAARLDVIKYTGPIKDLSDMALSYNIPLEFEVETNAYLQIQKEKLLKGLKGLYISRGSRIQIGHSENPISMILAGSTPEIENGQLGYISDVRLDFVSDQFLKAINIILCFIPDNSMKNKDISFETKFSTIQALETITLHTKDIDSRIKQFQDELERRDAALLFSFILMNAIQYNNSEGKFGLVDVSEKAAKFSVQKQDSIQSYVSFADELCTREVLISVLYFISDTMEVVTNKSNLNQGYRAIAELMEDFGNDLPTLVLILGSDMGDQSYEKYPFLKSILKMERYQMEYLNFQKSSENNVTFTIPEGIKGRVIPIEEFSVHSVIGYLAMMIGGLTR